MVEKAALKKAAPYLAGGALVIGGLWFASRLAVPEEGFTDLVVTTYLSEAPGGAPGETVLLMASGLRVRLEVFCR